MKSFLALLLFSVSCTIVSAQSFFIVDYDTSGQMNILKMMDENFVVTTLTNIPLSPGERVSDIAYSSAGVLYGITNTDRIISIDPSDGSSIEIHMFTSGIYSSLVYNADNTLVTINGQTNTLLFFNLDTQTVQSTFQLNTTTPGDLTYYKGNLLFQGEANEGDILAYDGITVKPVACAEVIGYWGFSNYTTACNSNLLYAFVGPGMIYEYDIENEINTLVADISADTFDIQGTTTVNEYLASACPLEVLTEIDCRLGVSEAALSQIELYPNPVKDVLMVDGVNTSDSILYTLYNFQGSQLKSGVLSEIIVLEELAAGIYFISLHNPSKTVSVAKKLIKI